MARGVHNVDLHIVVHAAAVLGQNGDAALALDVTGVHYALGNLLVVAEGAALAQHLVHQRSLAMVNVRDNGNVAQIFPFHIKTSFLFRAALVWAHRPAFVFNQRKEGNAVRFMHGMPVVSSIHRPL